MNKIISELNFNFIPSIKKRGEDDTKDYMCYSCFKKELDGEILKDTALMWGNGVIDPSSQLENSMCNDCFKLELDEPNFSRHLLSPYLYCTKCGLDLEKDNDLFNVIRGICNHCFLEVANPDHSCIRCNPTFQVPQEAKNE
jgi:hypothetical protein